MTSKILFTSILLLAIGSIAYAQQPPTGRRAKRVWDQTHPAPTRTQSTLPILKTPAGTVIAAATGIQLGQWLPRDIRKKVAKVQYDVRSGLGIGRTHRRGGIF